MRSYTVRKASGEVPLSGQVIGTAWARAAELDIDSYPWFKSGQKEQTTVRLLFDQRAIHVQFLCEGKHIYADQTEINSAVCRDSCVEFFAQPALQTDQRYFNLEINCCGNFLLGWGINKQEIAWNFVEPQLSSKYLRIASSITAPTKQESLKDNGWWVAAEIPFELLSQLSGREIQLSSGSTWRANFYRCGGRTNQQYACWNRVGTANPDYHQPEFFGELVFE